MRFGAIARRWWLLALGVVGMVAGIILLTRPAPSSFGWTAYAPHSNTVFVPQSPGDFVAIGGLLAALGLALAAGWVGFAIGRRSKRPRHPDAP